MAPDSLRQAAQLSFSFSNKVRSYFPGFIFCLLIVIASVYITEHYGGPALLMALLFGMAFHSLSQYPEYKTGIEFCSTTLLRLGVALLGVRISLDQVSELGSLPLINVGVTLPATIIFSLLFGKLLNLNLFQRLVAGVAVAICGVSAALAVAAIIPGKDKNTKNLLAIAVGVTGLSTLSMIFYPGLAKTLGLGIEQTGVFLGSSIHDVAQVAGAGYLLSYEVGDLATYTKMLRVALLVPIVFLLSLIFKTQESNQSKLPWFLIVFALLAGINSLHLIPQVVVEYATNGSKLFLMLALAAMGVRTNLLEMASVGWNPFILLLLNSLFIGICSLGFVMLL